MKCTLYRTRDAAIRRMWKVQAKRASRLGREFTLTLEEFTALVSALCAYCDKPPAMTGWTEGRYPVQGIDRKDNTKFYTPENSAPCCKDCNSIKSNLFTPEETRVMAQALKRFRKRRDSES